MCNSVKKNWLLGLWNTDILVADPPTQPSVFDNLAMSFNLLNIPIFVAACVSNLAHQLF